jgi:redox-sensitive bicupin YhaK (pirin superfamily)
MDDPVLQQVELGPQWPTIDPFLFCAHHDDAYPAGNDEMGPDASLAGRDIGMDFEGRDGWRMYHGQRIPGFPPHPHRGFETVTYVRKGFIDHADSLGAAARFGRGDVQWLTAGGGIQHSEMFPLLDRDGPNPLELFQIWLNLPAADKMVDAHFTMLWGEDVPKVAVGEEGGPQAEITVIAGSLDGVTPPSPPPASWASHAEADVAIWHVRLDPGASWTMPPAAGADTVRTLYVFDGASLRVAGHDGVLPVDTGVVLRSEVAVDLSSDDGVECLVLQGRPLGEPVARYGPFVMTTREQIQEAFEDYQRTQFGGWPWPDDDPVHDRERGRFARHADGRVEEREAAPTG